ncbi:MAG: DUF4382 domain-containing protein [Dehalococcoidales bacterium]|nr:DUF4382 domain-containing protein [Dehalococcoidales bacterium]
MRIRERKLWQFLTSLLVFIVVFGLIGSFACTPGQEKLVEGILQNVDSANGEITIVTRDGRTITLTIDTEGTVETEEGTSSLRTLEPGASVEVKVSKDERVARGIKAHQAKVEGTIVSIEGNEIIIESEGGRQVTVLVTELTRIELEDDFTGTLADLQTGLEVEVKFDPESQVAFKIDTEEGEEAESYGLAPAPGGGWGILEIRVTDPPPADVKSAVVHLTNIEVHRVSGNTSGWIPVIGAPPSFDLMAVAEVAVVLGSANVTAGSFTQIRMDVDRVEVETIDNVSYTANVSSGKLRIVRPFNVGGGKKTVLTLDFDGKRSLVITGSDRYLFKPVVKLEIEHEVKAESEDGKDKGKGQEQGQGQEEGRGRGRGEEQETEEIDFEGTIESVDGNIWTMTIEGETRTVDVSEAEIEGEPAAGLQAKVEGVVVDDTIKASEVEIKEAEG